jgi:hypothetical protein
MTFVETDLLPFAAVGFFAQLIDGALGMAFGTISNMLLLSLGVPPAAASAGVHTAESFTSAASALSHVAHRNVDWRLFARLLLPGVIGGVMGAYVLTNISAETARPLVLAYLTLIGLYLLWRGIKCPPSEKAPKMVEPLALVGGFLDGAGGGGWGAVVTSNLLVQGASPRKARHRQRGRIFPDCDRLGDLHSGSRRGSLHGRHARPPDGRRCRRSAGRVPGRSLACETDPHHRGVGPDVDLRVRDRERNAIDRRRQRPSCSQPRGSGLAFACAAGTPRVAPTFEYG